MIIETRIKWAGYFPGHSVVFWDKTPYPHMSELKMGMVNLHVQWTSMVCLGSNKLMTHDLMLWKQGYELLWYRPPSLSADLPLRQGTSNFSTKILYVAFI